MVNDRSLFEKLNDDKLSRRTVLKIGIATGVGMAGLAAAGCTSPTTSPLASATATPLPTALPVLTNGAGYLKTDHQAAIFVGKAKGIFEKYGVDLKITNFAAGPAMMQQLSGGTIDLGFAGVPPIISVIDKDPTVKIIAALQGNGSGIIVGNSSGITKVADLKGKKIAIPSVGSIQDIMLRKLLADNNIDYTKDVTISTIAAGQQPAAISAGTVDAAFTWEPFVSQAEMKGLATVLIRSDKIQPNHPCCAVATTTKTIQQYPDTLKAFLKGLNEATQFVISNPQDTAQVLASNPDYTGVDAGIEAHSLPNMLFIAKPDETFISGTENFAKEMKKLTAVGLTKDHDRNDLFDLTLINQVVQ